MRSAGDLDPSRWQRIRAVFEGALELEPAAREAFVIDRCAGDEALLAEVESLLEAEEIVETEIPGFATLLPLLGPVLEGLVPRDPEPPFHWGPLVVTRKIGAGSFGQVYRAHDAQLRRDVALKLRGVDSSGRTDGGEGYLEEARRLARVRHPNVLVVHGAEIHDGWAGIWTDLVPGDTLDLLLHRNGPFSRESLLRVGVDLCRALEAVHAAGLVHGDVKPSNAMQDEDGRVLLMDFGSGLSASESGDGEAPESTPGSHAGGNEATEPVTAAEAAARAGAGADEGEVSNPTAPTHNKPSARVDDVGARPRQGTPVAMAPELLAGAEPSVATDVYALGVLLYRLASGQYPFRAAGLEEIRARLAAQDRIPLDELRPDLPSAFARVVHRALSPDPGGRPTAAREFGWLVAASLGGEESGSFETDGAASASASASASAEASGGARALAEAVASAEAESAGDTETSHLPHAATRFVGRSQELRQLRSLLIEPGLVTLVGPGGCGKTRIALRLAVELQRSLPGGSIWADLVALSEEEDLAAFVARAAGLRDEIGRSATETLTRWIGERPLLLVLDNAEHVRESVSEFVGVLLRSCPRLHLLVTSRMRLALSNERICRLAPMTLPVTRTNGEGLEILESDSVRLFLERAHRGGDHLRLTPETAPVVARIVRRVDGIPLAIELAAARVVSLGLSAVAARLEESFGLLSTRGRPRIGQGTGASPTADSHRSSHDPRAADRQSTLLHSIEWSYGLLTSEESRLLARLSVFVGGWSLGSAEDVCSDPDPARLMASADAEGTDNGIARPPISTSDIVDLLSALVEHSLVSVDPSDSEEPRFRLLETVREFATEKLRASGETGVWVERHLAWVEREVTRRGPAIHGPEMPQQIAWFDRERGNLQSAMRHLHALASTSAESADRWVNLCIHARPYWYHRGLLREGLENFRLALSFASAGSTTQPLGLIAVAGFNSSLGNPDSAMEAARESIALSRAQGMQNTLASGLTMLAGLYTDRGCHADARDCFREALALRESTANHASSTAILCNLGVLEATIGDLAAAQTWYERALELARRHRDDSSLGHVSANLALTKIERGQLEGVRELATESLRAIRRTSSVASLWVGIRPMVLLEIAEGRLPEARSYVLEGLAGLGREPRVPAWIGMLDTAVDLLVARGGHAEAIEILGSIDAAREQTATLLPAGFRARWDARRDGLRVALGDPAFSSAWARGRVRSMADAWEFAHRVI